MKTRGFTIIEMLVIVVIAAILSALLVVGIGEARKFALRSSCMSNLSQLMIATKLYSADSDGYMPPYGFFHTTQYFANRAGWKGALMQYKASDDQFYCPADPHRRTATRGEWHDHLDTSYTLTISALALAEPGASTFRLNLDRAPQPASTGLYLDQETIIRDDSGQTINRYTSHGERFNVVYIDGHVSNERLPVR
jgi:prepilin-type processing-associated H-X9-DG protein